MNPPDDDPVDALLSEQMRAPLPPIERWSPAVELESRMRILGDGTWLHDGSPIVRPELVRLFAGILCRENDQYWLVTPGDRQRIDVDDAPFVGVALHRSGQGPDQRLLVTTNTGRHVLIDATHPLRVDDTGQAPPKPRRSRARKVENDPHIPGTSEVDGD